MSDRQLGALLACIVAGGALSAQRDLPGATPAWPPRVATPRADERPPNILILLADDLGADMLGFYGHAGAPPTPNLDRLASEGVVFQNAWSQPTCSPSRATIQTGRHGYRTTIGIPISTFSGDPALPLDEVTLPELLDVGTDFEYAHAAIGKWHLGSSQVGGNLAPNLAGYSHFAGSLEGQIASYFSWTKVVDGNAQHVTRYATSENVDDALRWIHGQGKPWLCSVAFQAPHAPFHRPPEHLHTRDLPSGDPRPWCGAAGDVEPEPFHAAMIEALDSEIGRLLDGLAPEVRARTTVFFLGDNGTDTCVAPTTRAKGSLYEGGVHVPFLVAGAGVAKPGVSDALVSSTDLFASVADLAGVDLEATFSGQQFDSLSVVPYLEDVTRPGVRKWLYAEVFTPNGPGNPVPLPVCPTTEVCHEDLGFQGPGAVAFSVCGPPLYGIQGSNVVPVRLRNAPPSALATLFIGAYDPAFSPALGGWVVSEFPDAGIDFTTNAAGELDASIWTGGASSELHYQFVVEDSSQAQGYALSNAVRIEPLWTDMQAARNQRYKLIRVHPCREELYDLWTDPDESVNLLQGPLAVREQRAYDWLSEGLDLVRAP